MVWVQTPITWKGAAVCTLIDVFFFKHIDTKFTNKAMGVKE